MTQPRRPLRGKKLLVAALGVGVLKLTGCLGMGGTSGNLVAPPPCDDAGNYTCQDLAGADLRPADGGARD
jgi:hypothetical protein